MRDLRNKDLSPIKIVPNRKFAMPRQEALQTKTVSDQVLENQYMYIWQKLSLRYFELSQTYFRLCALYFQLSAGSFFQSKK